MISFSKPSKIVHKTILPPKHHEKWLIRVLILVGILSSVIFGLWFFQEKYVGNKMIFFLLAVTLSYKFLHFLYEWFYINSISVSAPPKLEKTWSVDMLTTFVPGEPYDMVEETLRAMVAVKYPHETFLCDEGNDPYLKKVCDELGVVHVYRGKDKSGAKAGNINYTLEHYARGEIVIILDPDHVPVPEMIDQVLPFFEDPKIAFAQSIQGYFNQNESWVAKGAAEQTYMFYGPLMMGMNAHGTVQAIGANCAFRRAALDSIGGHAAGLCEDMHTSMQLHAKGWESVYVPELLTRGRVPASLKAYYQQQLKWSRGSFELLFSVLPKLFFRLSWRQRLHYLLTPLYFFYGIIGLLDLSIPIYCLFTFEVPLLFDFSEFLWKISPVIISVVLIRHYAQRFTLDRHESGFHIMGGLLRVGTWWIYLLGFIYSVLGKEVPYNPTPKEGIRENDFSSVLPNIVVIAISMAAVIYGLSQDNTLYTRIMATFATFNIFILGFIVLLGQQKLIYKNHQNLYSGKMSFYRQRWFRFRHFLVYPLLKSNWVAINFSIFLLLAVFFLPFDIWLDNAERLDSPAKQSGWLITGTPDRALRDSWLEVKKHSKPNTLNLHGKAILQDSICGFGAAALENCYLHLINAKKQKYIPIFTVSTDLIPDTAIGFDTFFWREFIQSVSSFKDPVVLQFSSKILPAADSSYFAEEKAIFRNAVNHFREMGAANAVFSWTFNKQAFFPGERYVDLIITSPEDLKESRNTFHRKKPLLLSVNTRDDISEIVSDLSLWARHKDQLIGWFSPGGKILMDDFPPRPVRLIQNENAETGYPFNLPNEIEKSSRITFDEPAQKFIWQHNGAPQYIKGVVYNPESHWRDYKWPLTRRQLDEDFKLIKEMGANTISRIGSSEYDKNIFRAARQHDLSIIYGLDIDPGVDFINEPEKVRQIREKILSEVQQFKDQDPIIAWTINNGGWMKLTTYFHMPYLIEVRQAYVKLVRDLILEIKKIDPERPLIFTFDGNQNLPGAFEENLSSLSMVDLIGINTTRAKRISQLKELIEKHHLNLPYLVTEFGVKNNWDWDEDLLTEEKRIIEPSSFEKARTYSTLWRIIEEDASNNLGGIAYCWKDRLAGTLTLSGITDYKGRLKPAYYSLKEHYTGHKQSFPIGDLVLSDDMYQLQPSAQFNNSRKEPLHFEWQVKKGEYLKTSFEIDFDYMETKNLEFMVKKNLCKLLGYRYIPSNLGNELVINRNVNDNERVYLFISNDQGQVVTASYPVINTGY